MPKRQAIYQGSIVDLGIEQATLPDGRQIDLEIVRHPGGAVIACLNQNNELCLIRQFRHAADGWIWELPAGVLEPEELALETAKRELIEETGVRGQGWQSMGAIYSTPGFCDEQLYLFFARVAALGMAEPELNEFIEVHWLALDEAVERAINNEISDAKTVIGILRAAAYVASGAE